MKVATRLPRRWAPAASSQQAAAEFSKVTAAADVASPGDNWEAAPNQFQSGVQNEAASVKGFPRRIDAAEVMSRLWQGGRQLSAE